MMGELSGRRHVCGRVEGGRGSVSTGPAHMSQEGFVRVGLRRKWPVGEDLGV